MSDLARILNLLSHAVPGSGSVTALVIELSEIRLGAVLLRRSPIWTYAVVKGQEDTGWGRHWQSLTSRLSPEDIADLYEVGTTPGGDDITPALRRYINQNTPASADILLPVGSLCTTKAFEQVLHERFASAKILKAHRELSLPNKLDWQAVRQEIAQIYPPQVDGDYMLQTVTLDDSAKLTRQLLPFFKTGDQPPTSTPPTFHKRRLFRPIGLPGSRPTPVNLVVLKDNKVVLKKRANPTKDVFTTQWWFNYHDDTLRVKIADQSGGIAPLSDITDDELSRLLQAPLPALDPKRFLDLVFIVDGTMRSGTNIGSEDQPDWEWNPDLTKAKHFIAALLEDLEQDPGLDARCALYLYGDWPHSGGAEYTLRSWPFQSPGELRSVVERGTEVAPTKDRDYEALLELALYQVRSKVQWRPLAGKFVLIMGYAPPHPPTGENLDLAQFGFKHEPFTSGINWEEELKRLRQDRIQILALWVPYPGLGRRHPCMRYSRHVWVQLAGGDRQLYEDPALKAETGAQVRRAIHDQLTVRYLLHEPLLWPLHDRLTLYAAPGEGFRFKPLGKGVLDE